MEDDRVAAQFAGASHALSLSCTHAHTHTHTHTHTYTLLFQERLVDLLHHMHAPHVQTNTNESIASPLDLMVVIVL